MLKLCGFHVSNYHNKVRLAMLEKDLPFEEDSNCFPSQKDEHLAKSPMGKVPYLIVDGVLLRESQVICEYLEDAYPRKPLLPKEPLARAQARELIAFMELHMDLVVRRLFGGLFGGEPYSDETKSEVERDIARGVRAFKVVAKFDPFVAGRELTLADCAAVPHLPLVSLATRQAFGSDALEGIAQLKPYLKMLGERPAFARVNEDRKVAQAALFARVKK